MSLDRVPPGQVAAVVTHLEMSAPPIVPRIQSSLELVVLQRPPLDDYRRLFRAIGSPWLWFSRLAMDDATLAAIVHDALVEVYAVAEGSDHEAGLLELDFRVRGKCQLAFVGLAPRLAGQGHGRWLLVEALCLAWQPGIERIGVHTCTLDHPAALPAYCRAGFIATGRSVEIFADPRLAGILPLDCAPQVPLVGAAPASCA